MPSTLEPIKGIQLTDKPAGISRCGLSNATFAQHRFTSEWYELSDQGQVIGTVLDLDFYRHDIEVWQRLLQKLKLFLVSFSGFNFLLVLKREVKIALVRKTLSFPKSSTIILGYLDVCPPLQFILTGLGLPFI